MVPHYLCGHPQEWQGSEGSVESGVQIRWGAIAGACGQAEEEGEVVFTNLGIEKQSSHRLLAQFLHS